MPFLYLIFGNDRGLLWDTGSRNGNLAPLSSTWCMTGWSAIIAKASRSL